MVIKARTSFLPHVEVTTDARERYTTARARHHFNATFITRLFVAANQRGRCERVNEHVSHCGKKSNINGRTNCPSERTRRVDVFLRPWCNYTTSGAVASQPLLPSTLLSTRSLFAARSF